MSSTGLDLVIRAIDIALDVRKLVFALGGILATWVVFWFFAALGLNNGVGATIISLLIGLAVAWVVWAIPVGAIAWLSQAEVQGQPTTMRAAFSASLQRLGPLVLTPLLLVLGLLIVYIVEWLLFLPARIPALGEIWVSVLFVPITLLNVAVLVFVVGAAWLMPAIVVYEGVGPLATLDRALETARRSPGRILTYLALVFLLMAVAGTVLFVLVLFSSGQALGITASHLSAQRMGYLFPNIFWLNMLPSLLTRPMDMIPFLLSGGFGPSMSGFSRFTPMEARIGGFLYQLGLAILGGIVVAVPNIIFPIAASCAIYPSVRPSALPAPTPVQPAPLPVAPAAAMTLPVSSLAGASAAGSVTPAVPTIDLCPNCHAPLRPQSKFCTSCGHKL